MKIGKVMKVVGALIGSIGILWGIFILINNISWMLESGDWSIIFTSVLMGGQFVIGGLLMYGFGEVIDLLVSINDSLKNKE